MASAAVLLLPVSANADEPLELVARPGVAPILGPDKPTSAVWSYVGRVPGPTLKYRQGERLRVNLTNRLEAATSIHWHGLRLPNAMDGVPYVTQPPVTPESSFLYEFDLKDAGTFWYHPHIQSSEQIGRGLHGPLIVAEQEPPQVDRDLLWMLDDWRVTADGQLAGNFNDYYDRSHEGRIGNTVTINGAVLAEESVRAGERVRLRLVNVANARYFALRFTDHTPVVIAVDGQPCDPHEPAGGQIVLGPSMRADIILDMANAPGGRFPVVDDYYKNKTFTLTDLAYTDQPSLRDSPLDAPIRLPANPVPKPDLNQATRHKILLEGGAGGAMAGGNFEGKLLNLTQLADLGMAWALNGEICGGNHRMTPLIVVERGQNVIIEMANDTYFDHPMHLHGHSFQVLTRNGQAVPHDIWSDTVIVRRNERVEVGLVADNPGNWMFHCHILEHQEAGMMGVFRVT